MCSGYLKDALTYWRGSFSDKALNTPDKKQLLNYFRAQMKLSNP